MAFWNRLKDLFHREEPSKPSKPSKPLRKAEGTKKRRKKTLNKYPPLDTLPQVMRKEFRFFQGELKRRYDQLLESQTQRIVDQKERIQRLEELLQKLQYNQHTLLENFRLLLEKIPGLAKYLGKEAEIVVSATGGRQTKVNEPSPKRIAQPNISSNLANEYYGELIEILKAGPMSYEEIAMAFNVSKGRAYGLVSEAIANGIPIKKIPDGNRKVKIVLKGNRFSQDH